MNLLEAYFKANRTKFLKREKMIKEQLIKEEKKNPPDNCLKCIFFYGSYEMNEKYYRAKCGITGKYTTTDREPPKWCKLREARV